MSKKNSNRKIFKQHKQKNKSKITKNNNQTTEHKSTSNQLLSIALQHHQSGNLQQAESLYNQILQNDPNHVDALHLLGVIASQVGKNDTAVELMSKAINIMPSSPELYSDLGNVFKAKGKLDKARENYMHALRLKPDYPDAHNNLGIVLRNQGKLDDAVQHYKQALQLSPDYTEAYNNLGNAYKELKKFEAAIECYMHALNIKPNFAEAHINLGNVLESQGKLDEAVDHYRQTLQFDPNNFDAIAGEADVLLTKGEFKKSYQYIQPYITNKIKNVRMAIVYSEICSHLDKDKDAIKLLECILEQNHTNYAEQILLKFQLGKLNDKVKQYDAAFNWYQGVNALVQTNFDPIYLDKQISDLVSTFNKDKINLLPRPRASSNLPIFIIGMPRSGTSLVEQILASHPQIYGAGELEEIRKITKSLPHILKTNMPYPQCISMISQEQLDDIAQRYINRLKIFSSDSVRITDKLPQNFMHLGLIKLMFPKASIIHCKRDPLDTCLSIYFQNFDGRHDYAYDLINIGTYYKQYQRLMHYWNEKLCIPMLEVQYEDLILKQEEISRKMIEYVELGWDDKCIRFYETKRIVNTASNQQVRKPIYTHSVARWKNYEHHLCHLIKALK